VVIIFDYGHGFIQICLKVLSEARVTGTVTTELRAGEGLGDTTGRISYENRGECFFLPYTKDDVEGNVTLSSGDAVSFQIATNQRYLIQFFSMHLRMIIFLFQRQSGGVSH